jgi:hypothetical protein
VQGLQFLKLEEGCLCRRSVETISLQRRNDFMLLSNMTFALRDVTQGNRQMAQDRGPVHGRA